MLELVSEDDAQGREDGELVEHHTKYEEVHGEDETMIMTKSKHSILHIRLRKEGKCKIPSKELIKISNKAQLRTDKCLKKHPKACKIKNGDPSDWIRKQVRKDIEMKKK